MSMNNRQDFRASEKAMAEETFMAKFHEHYGKEERERPFSDYEPAYRFGHQLAGQHQNKPWAEVEGIAEQEWQEQYHVTGAGIWDDMKEAVYEGWKSLQGSFGNEQPRYDVPPNVSNKS